MKVLAVGDIHGCFYTFKKFLETYWNKKNEFLVITGDIINKGPHSCEALLYYFELKKEYPYQVFLLRGNHEQDFLNSLNSNKSNGYKKLVSQLKAEGVGKQKLIDWLENLPFKWETPHMLISHAGISEKAKHPYSASSANGVLYNRTALKDVGKVQVHGHDVLQSDQPHFNKKSNSWNVDTGAWTGKYLSGIRLTQKGKFKEFVQEKMHPADFTRK